MVSIFPSLVLGGDFNINGSSLFCSMKLGSKVSSSDDFSGASRIS
jgi:hypothetical protein